MRESLSGRRSESSSSRRSGGSTSTSPRSSSGDDSWQATGVALHRLALHAYSYLHLPLVAGIVLFALGLKTTLGHPGEALDTVPAVALCGGAALYLLAEVAILYRTSRRIFRRRTIGMVVLLALIPVALAIPALAALACVSAVCAFVVAYEAIRHRDHRLQVRHPEIAG